MHPALRSVTLPDTGSRRLPFAVGLVASTGQDAVPDEDASGRRVAVALSAHDGGFFLLDVIEVDGRTGVTLDDWARFCSLVMQADAEAVVVLGLDDVDRAGVEAIADELRLVVRVVPTEALEPPGTARSTGGSAAPGVLAADRPDQIQEPGAGRGGREGERFAPERAKGDP